MLKISINTYCNDHFKHNKVTYWYTSAQVWPLKNNTYKHMKWAITKVDTHRYDHWRITSDRLKKINMNRRNKPWPIGFYQHDIWRIRYWYSSALEPICIGTLVLIYISTGLTDQKNKNEQMKPPLRRKIILRYPSQKGMNKI